MGLFVGGVEGGERRCDFTGTDFFSAIAVSLCVAFVFLRHLVAGIIVPLIWVSIEPGEDHNLLDNRAGGYHIPLAPGQVAMLSDDRKSKWL